MAYNVTLNIRAIKALEKINEPYYSNIKKAIYNLAHNPRPVGFKKLKGRDGYRVYSIRHCPASPRPKKVGKYINSALAGLRWYEPVNRGNNFMVNSCDPFVSI